MNIYSKLHGRYLGVDPAWPHVVYADREHGGAWEEQELIPHPDHKDQFIHRFIAANVVLSQQPDGSFQTRPAGTTGAWETRYATQQPDPHGFSYRYDDQGALLLPILEIEAVK